MRCDYQSFTQPSESVAGVAGVVLGLFLIAVVPTEPCAELPLPIDIVGLLFVERRCAPGPGPGPVLPLLLLRLALIAEPPILSRESWYSGL